MALDDNDTRLPPRSASSSSIHSDDDIELADLDDIAVTPNPRLPNGKHVSFGDHDDDSDDDELENGDEGSRGLLSFRRTRGRERIPVGSWPQVKSIVIESAPTLLLTTVGLLFTGELLDQVSRWQAMTQVDQLIMIIPVILNLKGNLEMNLSARLGTAANVGELDKSDIRRKMVLGNLSLLQVQAAVVSFVAACASFILGLVIPHIVSTPQRPSNGTVLIPPDATTSISRYFKSALPLHQARRPRPPIPPLDRKSGIAEFLMVASTAMSAASLSSIILGSFMCFLVVVCRQFGRDPDNIAPPVASCLGDLVTLFLVGAVSALLINFINTPFPFIVMILTILFSASCGLFTYRNSLVRPLITQGWPPLFGAMIISSLTGIVLDLFVTRYEGFALLAVVISGLPGSVGSIFVSRLSTSLHAAALRSTPSRAQKTAMRGEPSPRLAMLTLLLITLPVEIIFLALLHWLGWLKLPFLFVGFSVLFFCAAVTTSLFLARLLTDFLWTKNLDPDMWALPIHSAAMDLVGQLLLVVCFEIVQALGGKVKSRIRSE